MFRASGRTFVAVTMAVSLTACMRDRMDNNGGSGNNDGGTGGPTTPGPVATTGTISGTVTAATAGISGARIALGTTATATTASSGQYTFADVASGMHTVTLTVPGGFTLAPSETAAKGTTVAAGQTSTVNWTLVQPAAPPQTFDVALDPTRFRPRDVTIARGDTVRWTNAQPVFHTISPDDRNQPGAWRTENMPARTGATFSHVFNTEGTFNYSCTVHIGMTGVVRVR